MSSCVVIAKAVANLLNDTLWDWPTQIVPMSPTALKLTPHQFQAAVSPLAKRDENQQLELYVAPLNIEESDIRDSCRRRWHYEVECSVMRVLAPGDNERQPATLNDIDNHIEFVEQVRDLLDSNRDIGGWGSLRQLQARPFNENMLTTEHVFLGTVNAVILA